MSSVSKHASRHVQAICYRTYPGGLLEVTRPVKVENEFGWEVRVPARFLTDGASIPRLLWPIVGHPFQGEFLQAAVVHDLLCHHAWLLGSYQHRVMADAYFFWLLTELKVSWWKRTAMYLAVRLWGRWCYRPKNIDHFVEVTKHATEMAQIMTEKKAGVGDATISMVCDDDDDFGAGLLDEPDEPSGSGTAVASEHA
ncbi:DUF1353 domain-containing protein [Lacunimicrobium album]